MKLFVSTHHTSCIGTAFADRARDGLGQFLDERVNPVLAITPQLGHDLIDRQH